MNNSAIRESANGSVVAYFGALDDVFYLQDAATSPSGFSYNLGLDVADAAFAPDGKSLVVIGSGKNKKLTHFEWPSGKLLKQIDLKSSNDANTRVFFITDNKHVVTLDGQTWTLWNLEKGMQETSKVFPFKLVKLAPNKEEHEIGSASSFSVFPDRLPDPEIEPPMPTSDAYTHKSGKTFTRTYYTINYRDKKKSLERAAFALVLGNTALACEEYSPQTVAPVNIVETTGKILRACERKHTITPPKYSIMEATLCASPSGKWLIEARSYATDATHYFITVWDTATGKEMAYREWSNEKNDIKLALDMPCSVIARECGELLLSSDRGFFRWDWKNNHEPIKVAPDISKCQFFRNLKDDSLISARVAEGMGQYDLKTNSFVNFNHYVEPRMHSLAVSNDGRFFASAGKDGKAAVWDLSAAALVGQTDIRKPLTGKNASVGARLIFAPDNTSLLLARGVTHIRKNDQWNFPHIITDLERMYERQAPLKLAYINDTRWELEKWDFKKGARQALFVNDSLVSHENHWWSFAMNERFAALYTARDIRRLDLNAEKELPRIPLGNDLSLKEMLVKNISFTARLFLCPGRSELFVNGYNTLFIDLVSGKVLENLPKGLIEEGVISPDGKWFVGVDSQGVKVAPINDIKSAGGGYPPGFDIMFEPNGRRFAYLGKESLIITELPQSMTTKAPIWARQFGIALVPKTAEWLACHYTTQSKVGCWSHADFRLLAGGKNILIGGESGAMLIDVELGKTLAYFYVFPDNSWLITTPDGLFTGSANASKMLHLMKAGCDVTTEKEIEARRQPEEIRKRLRACVLSQKNLDWKPIMPSDASVAPDGARPTDEF